MSYGKFAIDILRSDLGFFREINGSWIVVYQGENEQLKNYPLYLKLKKPSPLSPLSPLSPSQEGWAAAGIENCTLFESYDEACEGARQSSYIMRGEPNVLSRIVQITIKVDVQIDLLEDRPINALDALAEIKP